MEELHQHGVLLRLARADPPQSRPPGAPVHHHPRPQALQVAAPLTLTARLRGDGTRVCGLSARVARLLAVQPPHDRPPPEALAALAGQDPIVDPRGLVSTHEARCVHGDAICDNWNSLAKDPINTNL